MTDEELKKFQKENCVRNGIVCKWASEKAGSGRPCCLKVRVKTKDNKCLSREEGKEKGEFVVEVYHQTSKHNCCSFFINGNLAGQLIILKKDFDSFITRLNITKQAHDRYY